MQRKLKAMGAILLCSSASAGGGSIDYVREGKLGRALVEEIRGKWIYLPELELVMVDENDGVIGYIMFSRFHLKGRYEDELLLFSPAAVKTTLQRQHISRYLIECGFENAISIGFEAVFA